MGIHKKIWLSAAGLLLALLFVPMFALADTVTTVEPDGADVGFSAFEIFQNSKLGSGPIDGPRDIEHLFETDDSAGMGTVFQFHVNKYGDYDGSNLDRQRVELKAYNSSHADVKAYEGDTMTYHWRFRVMPNYQMPPAGAFNHIFQLKAQGGDDGAPILTFTVGDGKLYFRHSPIGPTMDEVEVLSSTDWSNIVNTWVDATVTVENTEHGLISMTLKDVSSGAVLMAYSGYKDNWRDNADINRPKWGIYRKIFNGMDEADIQFAKFEITKHSETSGVIHPVDVTGDSHIEAEQYFSKHGLSFRQKKDGNRFNDAVMEIPVGWDVSEESNVLSYKLNVSNSLGTAYIHILGKALEAEASALELTVGDTTVDADVHLGSWGWTTVAISLADGPQTLEIAAAHAGVQLDKLVINASPTAPASSAILKLDGILLDGQPLTGFSSSVFDYRVNLPLGIAAAPTLTAQAAPGLIVTLGGEVPDAANNPAGTAVITVTDPADSRLSANYTVTFNYMRFAEPPPPMIIYPIVSAQGPSTPSRFYDGDITTIWDNKPPGGDDNANNDKYTDVVLDLGEVQPLKYAFIGFGGGNNRVSFKFDLLVSVDGTTFTSVFGEPVWSNGNVFDMQRFSFDETPARYIMYRGYAGKKNNGTGGLEKYNKVRQMIVAGDTKLAYGEEEVRLDMTANAAHQLSLTLTHADGSTRDVTSLAAYRSYNESVATVDTSGLVTAVANGSTVTEATYGYHMKPIDVFVGDAVIIVPPTWPSGFKAQAVEVYEDGVFLTWTAAASDLGVRNYRIYDADNNVVLAEVGNVLHTEVGGLQPGTTYNLVIQAVDVNGTTNPLEHGPKLLFTTRGGTPEPSEPDPEGTLIFEAEDLAGAGRYVLTPGDLNMKFNSESGASAGGNFQVDFREASGQSVEFTVDMGVAGTYEVQYGYKRRTSRGIFQMSINGEPIGDPVDHYGPDGYVFVNVGSYTFASAGDYSFKLDIVGQNPDSSALGLVFDYIKLIPADESEPGEPGRTPIDILDPDFIESHGGTYITIRADADRSPYDVFGEAFDTDNPVEGATKTARQSPRWGEEAARHVENVYDANLGKTVFKVEVNGNDCFTCYLHNTTYDPVTDTFTGGNSDRQRIEIRPGENSDLVGLENDVTAYNWKLKLDGRVSRPSGFFHIFQYKAVNASGPVSGFDKEQLHDAVNYPTFQSDEDGNPILTLTVSTSVTPRLEFRYADIGSEAGQEILAAIPIDDIRDRWVDVTIKILNSESGWVTMEMKDAESGELLMEYNDPDRILDIWRRPEIKYNGQTFEGPYAAVDNMLNRPKWGIYRKADKSDSSVEDAIIYLADMTLYKSAVGVSPVNLAYGKKAYNVGDVNGNAFQLANAKAERLTDGVQADPANYADISLTSVPGDDGFSALGKLAWIGTQSSKKGNIVIDLGEKMDFNQIKLFAKSMRLKYVNVWISEDVGDYTEADVDSIAFVPVDAVQQDANGEWVFIHEANNGGNDAANTEYLIDLGKSYSSRYVKMYVENGSGSNRDNGDGTYTMTGPPRITELEIYNAPQKPANVNIDYTTGTTAVISWDDVPADHFIIYDGGVPLAQADTHVYTLAKLDPGAQYRLSVRTVYTDPYSFKPMLSAESNIVELQTDGDPIVPVPPASITANAADKTIEISWEIVPEAQGYRIILVTDAGERVVADDVKGDSYTIRDLSPGTTYTVNVYSIRRGTASAEAAAAQVTTSGVQHGSDNLLFNKEVQYTRVWNDDASSYGGGKALDNDIDGSRWVALKGSATAWLMADIGKVAPVSVLEYYSFQNRLKKVSFYYATDIEAFADPESEKWIKILTDDRVAQGKFGNPEISSIAEKIVLDEFTVDEVEGDINVNEVRAYGPLSFTEGSSMTAVDTKPTSVALNWQVVSTTLPITRYELYIGDQKMAELQPDATSYTVSGLSPNTGYTFRLRAVNESYSTLGGLIVQVVTPAGTEQPGPSEPEPSDPGPTIPRSSAPILVQSDTTDELIKTTITRETTPDGRVLTRVSVDGDSLASAAASRQLLELAFDTEGLGVVVELPTAVLFEAEGLTAVKIVSNGITYELPLSLLNGWHESERISIFIGAVDEQQAAAIEHAVATSGSEQVIPRPIEFRLFADDEEITNFNGIYVERTIALDQRVDPSLITAVWVDDRFELHHVPTIVIAQENGSLIVSRSPHNSIYTVISHNAAFSDLNRHWAEEDIVLLANRLIVKGQAPSVFHPEGTVTRAEFAAMLVRALGLPETNSQTFSDVPADAWFAGVVGAAERYGLINGFADGSFEPNKTISRQELAVMTARALNFAGHKAQPAPDRTLGFSDRGLIGDWSLQAVSQAVSANLMRGKPDGTFAPQAAATRAEAAVVILRLLRHLNLIT